VSFFRHFEHLQALLTSGRGRSFSSSNLDKPVNQFRAIFKKPAPVAASDVEEGEWSTAKRALRQAGWASIFYLVCPRLLFLSSYHANSCSNRSPPTFWVPSMLRSFFPILSLIAQQSPDSAFVPVSRSRLLDMSPEPSCTSSVRSKVNLEFNYRPMLSSDPQWA
jgi:hypothetical protein